MSQINPELDDYVELFRIYRQDLGAIYRLEDDDRYALLFAQVIRLLTPASPYNLALPEAFRVTALRYAAGDPATLAHMGQPANRHFMLSDLHDHVMLCGGLARLRAERSL
jgi:hypothetical protein